MVILMVMVWVMNMIAGKEKMTLLKKSYTDVDEFNNPIETEIEIEINNVLVSQDSAVMINTLFESSPEVDITVYLNKKYYDTIDTEDEFEYRNKRYTIVDAPILWETFKGSRIKPKLIVGLKHRS